MEAIAFFIFVAAIFFVMFWSVKEDPEADARKQKRKAIPWRKI